MNDVYIRIDLEIKKLLSSLQPIGAHKLRLAKRKEPPTIDRRLKDMKIQPHLKGFLHNIWVK
jgi:hypothetical protein